MDADTADKQLRGYISEASAAAAAFADCSDGADMPAAAAAGTAPAFLLSKCRPDWPLPPRSQNRRISSVLDTRVVEFWSPGGTVTISYVAEYESKS